MLKFPITQPVGQRLKTLRINAGLSEPEICSKLQMTAGDFSKLEEGRTELPMWRLTEIAHFFHINVHDLLKWEGTPDVAELKEEVELLARMNLKQAEEIIRLQRKIIELYNRSGDHRRIS